MIWRIALVVCVLGAAVGCGPSEGSEGGGSQRIDGRDVSAATMLRGSLAYGRLCRRCHGPTGQGDGRHGLALDRRPTNLRVGPYPVSTGGQDRLPTDAELANTIRVGVPSSGMPPHPMPEIDSDALVQYIKSLNPAWAPEEGSGS